MTTRRPTHDGKNDNNVPGYTDAKTMDLFSVKTEVEKRVKSQNLADMSALLLDAFSALPDEGDDLAEFLMGVEPVRLCALHSIVTASRALPFLLSQSALELCLKTAAELEHENLVEALLVLRSGYSAKTAKDALVNMCFSACIGSEDGYASLYAQFQALAALLELKARVKSDHKNMEKMRSKLTAEQKTAFAMSLVDKAEDMLFYDQSAALRYFEIACDLSEEITKPMEPFWQKTKETLSSSQELRFCSWIKEQRAFLARGRKKLSAGLNSIMSEEDAFVLEQQATQLLCGMAQRLWKVACNLCAVRNQNNPFAFLVLGSAATEGMSLYSDLEYVVLVQNESDKSLFQQVATVFDALVISLGETPCPGAFSGMGGKLLRHGFMIDPNLAPSRLGSRFNDFVGTVDNVLGLITVGSDQFDILDVTLCSARFLFGDDALAASFRNEMQKILSNKGQVLRTRVLQMIPELLLDRVSGDYVNVKEMLQRVPSYVFQSVRLEAGVDCVFGGASAKVAGTVAQELVTHAVLDALRRCYYRGTILRAQAQYDAGADCVVRLVRAEWMKDAVEVIFPAVEAVKNVLAGGMPKIERLERVVLPAEVNKVWNRAKNTACPDCSGWGMLRCRGSMLVEQRQRMQWLVTALLSNDAEESQYAKSKLCTELHDGLIFQHLWRADLYSMTIEKEGELEEMLFSSCCECLKGMLQTELLCFGKFQKKKAKKKKKKSTKQATSAGMQKWWFKLQAELLQLEKVGRIDREVKANSFLGKMLERIHQAFERQDAENIALVLKDEKELLELFLGLVRFHAFLDCSPGRIRECWELYVKVQHARETNAATLSDWLNVLEPSVSCYELFTMNFADQVEFTEQGHELFESATMPVLVSFLGDTHAGKTTLQKWITGSLALVNMTYDVTGNHGGTSANMTFHVVDSVPCPEIDTSVDVIFVDVEGCHSNADYEPLGLKNHPFWRSDSFVANWGKIEQKCNTQFRNWEKRQENVRQEFQVIKDAKTGRSLLMRQRNSVAGSLFMRLVYLASDIIVYVLDEPYPFKGGWTAKLDEYCSEAIGKLKFGVRPPTLIIVCNKISAEQCFDETQIKLKFKAEVTALEEHFSRVRFVPVCEWMSHGLFFQHINGLRGTINAEASFFATQKLKANIFLKGRERAELLSEIAHLFMDKGFDMQKVVLRIIRKRMENFVSIICDHFEAQSFARNDIDEEIGKCLKRVAFLISAQHSGEKVVNKIWKEFAQRSLETVQQEARSVLLKCGSEFHKTQRPFRTDECRDILCDIPEIFHTGQHKNFAVKDDPCVGAGLRFKNWLSKFFGRGDMPLVWEGNFVGSTLVESKGTLFGLEGWFEQMCRIHVDTPSQQDMVLNQKSLICLVVGWLKWKWPSKATGMLSSRVQEKFFVYDKRKGRSRDFCTLCERVLNEGRWRMVACTTCWFVFCGECNALLHLPEPKSVASLFTDKNTPFAMFMSEFSLMEKDVPRFNTCPVCASPWVCEEVGIVFENGRVFVPPGWWKGQSLKPIICTGGQALEKACRGVFAAVNDVAHSVHQNRLIRKVSLFNTHPVHCVVAHLPLEDTNMQTAMQLLKMAVWSVTADDKVEAFSETGAKTQLSGARKKGQDGDGSGRQTPEKVSTTAYQTLKMLVRNSSCVEMGTFCERLDHINRLRLSSVKNYTPDAMKEFLGSLDEMPRFFQNTEDVLCQRVQSWLGEEVNEVKVSLISSWGESFVQFHNEKLKKGVVWSDYPRPQNPSKSAGVVLPWSVFYHRLKLCIRKFWTPEKNSKYVFTFPRGVAVFAALVPQDA